MGVPDRRLGGGYRPWLTGTSATLLDPQRRRRVGGGLLTSDEECQESEAFTRRGLEIDRKPFRAVRQRP
jgi:hypothetical protein